eukprot:TRINITY_DN22862_c0_g1_i1.p1 TRINITY_DN22862_c0_g1~~TRINITY_DN22862_c0_g1_i1.p1  ORF type:complete len:196 (+),score=13.14 TRINITY_DN22862_c0_g1_i1:80-667(+)
MGCGGSTAKPGAGGAQLSPDPWRTADEEGTTCLLQDTTSAADPLKDLREEEACGRAGLCFEAYATRLVLEMYEAHILIRLQQRSEYKVIAARMVRTLRVPSCTLRALTKRRCSAGRRLSSPHTGHKYPLSTPGSDGLNRSADPRRARKNSSLTPTVPPSLPPRHPSACHGASHRFRNGLPAIHLGQVRLCQTTNA